MSELRKAIVEYLAAQDASHNAHEARLAVGTDWDALLTVIAPKAASTNPASIVVLGLTLDEVRRAVALADQYRPGWRSSQKPPSSPGE